MLVTALPLRAFVALCRPMPTTQSSSETDISSEESVYGDVSDRNSAEGLLEDGISSANVPVQALKFNPEGSIFALDERSSFSVQELRRQTTCTEMLSVRARDRQLVEILTAAIMKNGVSTHIHIVYPNPNEKTKNHEMN